MFMGRVARQTKRLYVLRMIVKLPYKPVANEALHAFPNYHLLW